MQQIIKVSVEFSKFETIIKLDIKPKTKLSMIPAFSVNLFTYGAYTKVLDSDLPQYLDELFDKNFTSDSNSRIHEYTNRDIFRSNSTRKTLSLNTQHKDLSHFLKLKVGKQILKLSSFSRSFDNLLMTLINGKKLVFAIN